MPDGKTSAAMERYEEYFGEDAREVMQDVLDELGVKPVGNAPADASPDASPGGEDRDDLILDAIHDGDTQRVESLRRQHQSYSEGTKGQVGMTSPEATG